MNTTLHIEIHDLDHHTTDVDYLVACVIDACADEGIESRYISYAVETKQ